MLLHYLGISCEVDRIYSAHLSKMVLASTIVAKGLVHLLSSWLVTTSVSRFFVLTQAVYVCQFIMDVGKFILLCHSGFICSAYFHSVLYRIKLGTFNKSFVTPK